MKPKDQARVNNKSVEKIEDMTMQLDFEEFGACDTAKSACRLVTRVQKVSRSGRGRTRVSADWIYSA
jgi:hypothetical protein